MKKNILKLIGFVAFASVMITSCIEDKDFEVPKAATITEPNLTGLEKTTFKAVKAAYDQAVAGGDQTLTFEQDLYIEGYVISSDQAGNFYKELIIQNHSDASTTSDNPRLGFRLPINVTSLYQTYQFGRKVYVKLNGLTIGVRNGVLNLAKDADLNQIQSYEYQDFILRSSEVATILPRVAMISDLTEADENTYVQLDNMQFLKNELGLTYAGEANDQFDGKRTIESCGNSATIPVETSTFADFKSLPVAQNKGSIKGVFTRDFRDDIFVILVNSAVDIMFDDENRCDPDVLECGAAASQGANVIFEENFESFNGFETAGWKNINANGGENLFSLRSYGGNSYAQASAFRSNEDPLEIWLITPAINLDSSSDEVLTFKSKTGFNNGAALSVVVSTDYNGTGNPKDFTWSQVDATYANGPSSGYERDFTDSGLINLSCLTGKVYVAFKYKGGSNGITTTFQVDDVKITGN